MDACRRVNFGELPPTQAWRVDAVCQRFEAEWRAEREPRIEDFCPRPTNRNGPPSSASCWHWSWGVAGSWRRTRPARVPHSLPRSHRGDRSGLRAEAGRIFRRGCTSTLSPPATSDRRHCPPHRPLQAVAEDRGRGHGCRLHGRAGDSHPATSGPEDHQAWSGFRPGDRPLRGRARPWP